MDHKLSLFGLIMVVAGSCIGIGIFLTPAFIAGQLHSPGWIMLVWLTGGISTLCAAFTFGEVASRFPCKAGIYYWLKETYGDFWGFLFGWFYISILVSGAIAAISLGFAQYADDFFRGLQVFSDPKATAVSLIVVLCLINCIGLKWGDWSTRLLTVLKLAGLLLIVGIGMTMSEHSPSFHLRYFEQNPDGGLASGFGVALVGVSFSYAGIQYVTFLAAEARNAALSVAWAMTLGVLLVCVLYMLTNFAYLKLLPVQEMVMSEIPAADAVNAAYPALGAIIPLIIMLSAAGTIAAFTLATPRMYQSMAEDGLFLPVFMKKHDRFNTPVYSIVFQSACAVAWVLFWGTFSNVITHLVLTNLIFMVMAACAIYILRRRSAEESAFKSPGYPVTPAIYIIISVYIILVTTISSPVSLVVSGVFVLIGWVIYRVWIRPETA